MSRLQLKMNLQPLNSTSVMQPVRKLIETVDYQSLSRSAPALAGDLAYLRFCTPRLSERRAQNHQVLINRARFHLRNAVWSWIETPAGRIRVFTFEPESDPTRGDVLIVHGWTSEASFMAVIAEQVRRAGFRAHVIDCPAHGLSPGDRTSLIGCAHAVAYAVNTLPQPHAILAHSMGCLAALMALEGRAPMQLHVRTEKLVLIASPERFQEVTLEHGHHLGLTPAAQRVFERHLERIAHRDIQSFRASALLASLGLPTLVLHGQNDHEVRPDCARQIDAACSNATLRVFDGLDHRRVLYAPPVIREAVKFLKGPESPS